ncbi:MAG: hypothetical protein ACREUG_02510 [Steroidobacteraceae bacterium]
MGAVMHRGAPPDWAVSRDGSGYGSGDGSGSGSGYGSGDGDGDGSYWTRCVQYFATKWSAAQRARLLELQTTGATIAYWRSDESGRACNGGSNAPVVPGTIEKITGPLLLCKRALHATLIPSKWKGARWWIVGLSGEVRGDEEKFGALEREVIGECL